MALVNRDSNPDNAAAAAADKTAAAAATPQPAAAQPSTAVAVQPARAVAVATSRSVSPFDSIRDAYRVEFNTLNAIMVSQGNFIEKDSEESLGDDITIQLLSFQDSFVISPGVEGAEGAKLARYSDDGKTTKDGDDVSTYLQGLKAAGYTKARMTQRLVLVGALQASTKKPELVGTLVQIDLPPSSKTMFDRYSIQAAFDVMQGKAKIEDTQMIRMTASTKKQDKNIYTVANFSRAVAAA